MADGSEQGIRWWFQNVIVPVVVAFIAGGGLYHLLDVAERPSPLTHDGGGPAPAAREGRPELNRESLTSRVWEFRHDEGDVISPEVRLLPNGKIEGVDHPNESRWGIEDGVLVFYHQSGEPSTRFTSVRYVDGRIVLQGRLLLPGDRPIVIHVLEER